MSEDDALLKVRSRIDNIDEKIQALLGERAECAMEVAKIKIAAGDTVFYRPDREVQVLQRIKDRNTSLLPDDEMARLFREIMSACLALEQPLKVAFLGPEGSYTQSAALKQFGHSAITVSVSAIDEVFREVESDNADYGVVPVENSTEGMVNHSMDMFVDSPLKICGEVQLRIHHHLLSKEDDFKDVKRIYSHQQSFAQCREWLNFNLPSVERVVINSNSEAARLASKESGAAAIAGKIAGEIYSLNSLAKNIEDHPDNTTRFLVVSKMLTDASGRDKTSLLLSMPNKAGALYSLLAPLQRNGVSMSRVESRPSKQGVWEYLFFVDVEGHMSDEHVKKALFEIEGNAAMYKVLGSYPRAVIS